MRDLGRSVFFLVCAMGLTLGVKGQQVHRVDPPNWWQSMGLDTLELLIHGSDLDTHFKVDEKAGEIAQVNLYGQGRLAHVKVALKSGQLPSQLGLQVGKLEVDFPLNQRQVFTREGLDESDLMYLITPDRFANGDHTNDVVAGMREQGIDRTALYARHGGDLKGIQHRLEHIKSLGATAVWINPVLENDMARDSYHGYAITDHYAVDARYGGNKALDHLVQEMRKTGLKHVADVVYNHWGSGHYLQKELVDSSMVHFTAEGQIPYSNFRFTAMTDPHKKSTDSSRFANGWFAGAMPDINQDHPVSSAYMRMATIWYVERFQVDALRCDTYAFSAPQFLERMNRELATCFPGLFVFGEVWAYSESSQAYFAPNKIEGTAVTGNDAVTDFTLWRSIHELYEASDKTQFGWSTGAGALYYRLASDVLYTRPEALVTFLDNHDDGRFLGQHDGDTSKLRSALTLLYFLRGIPTLYYGTELGLQGHESHGAIREDFPGFEEEFQDYTKIGGDLLNLCKELGFLRKEWAGKSDLKQYAPEQGWTVLERKTADKTYLLLLNATSNKRAARLSKKGMTLRISSGNGEEKFAPWEARIYTTSE